MPDISMCEGGMCTIKETCHRFKAEPSDYQSYFMKPPHDGVDEDGHSNCEHYWMVDKIKDRAKLYMSLKRSVVDRLTKEDEDEE